MINKTHSLQDQIRVNLFKILGTYFFLITSAILIIGIVGIFFYQNNQLNQYHELIKTKVEAEVGSALRETGALATSSLVWTGLTDSAGRDAYLSPLLQRINVNSPHKVDLLDYLGRDYIVTDSFDLGVRQKLSSVKRAVETETLYSELIHEDRVTYIATAVPIKAPFSDSSLGVLLVKFDLTNSISTLPLDPNILISFDEYGKSIKENSFLKTSLYEDLIIDVNNYKVSFSIGISKSITTSLIILIGASGLMFLGAFFVYLSLKKWSQKFALNTTDRLNQLVKAASYAASGKDFNFENKSTVDEIDTVLNSIQEIFSKQKKSNAKLLISSKVFETANEAILITDTSGNIVDINKALLSITQYDKEELIGKSAGILYRDQNELNIKNSIVESLRRFNYWKGETFFITKQGVGIPTLASITTLLDENNNSFGTVAIFSDISEIKSAQEQIRLQLYEDQLTKLQNFRAFSEYVEARVKNELSKPFIILFIDLDNFKGINDTYGHEEGDQSIIQMSKYLQNNLPNSSKLFRRSGDEFIAVVDVLESLEKSKNELSKVLHKISILLGADIKNQVSCTFSAGGAIFPDNADNILQLLIYADTALQYSKENGRERTTWFDDSVKEKIERKKSIEVKLLNAIEKNLIHLNYQPEIDLRTGEIIGFEALARWHDDELGFISPAEFIPLAEERGLIESATNSILRNIAIDLESIMAKFPNVKISLNASPKLFKDYALYRLLTNRLGDSQYLKNFVIEITESELIQNSTSAINQLKCIIQMGMEIAIDDFGKGFSSLSRLSEMPIHKLKIDSAFLVDYNSENSKKIVESIISLSHSLNLDITAEGVECEEQAQLLISLGCYKAQGYLYSRPVPLSKVLEFPQFLGNFKN